LKFCSLVSSYDEYTMGIVEEKFNYWIDNEIFVNDKQFRKSMVLSWKPIHYKEEPRILWSVEA